MLLSITCLHALVMIKCSFSYTMMCPHLSQWKFKGNQFCNRTLHYYCLLDDNSKTYVENCREDIEAERPGFKFVIEGALNRKPCDPKYFQPIKFWPNESSECAYIKSSCNAEGQVIVFNGNSTADSSCRCDYTKGFDFVHRPSHGCLCNPEHEDCSCYYKLCKIGYHLSPDYNCIGRSDWTGNFKCSVINTSIMVHLQRTDLDIKMMSDERTSVKDIWADAMINKAYLIVGAIVLSVLGALISYFMEKCCITLRDYCRRFLEYEMMERTDDTPEDKCDDNSTKGITLAVPVREVNDSASTASSKAESTDNEYTPKDDKDLIYKYIQEWSRDNKYFVETNASKHLMERITKSNCILLVGGTGEGKSSIIRHIALQLKNNEGYTIVPVVLEPATLKTSFCQKHHQVFVIDDFCGRDKICQSYVDLWSLQEHVNFFEKLIQSNKQSRNWKTRKGHVKILMACNANIFEEPTSSRLESYRKYLCFLSDHPLSEEDRSLIMKKYVLPETESTISDEFSFPLMCKLSQGKSAEQLLKFVEDPIQSIKDDLIKMRDQHTTQFCVMTLLVLLHNSMQEDWLDSSNENFQGEVLKAVTNVCSEFGIDVLKVSSRKRIKETISILEKTYLSKTGNKYNIIHPKIYDVAASLCGECFFDCFLNHASTEFVADRYQLESNGFKSQSNVINISPDKQKRYFDRLIKDLEAGDTYSFLHNKQLHSEKYRTLFIEYCNDRKPKITDLLSKVSNNIDQDVTNVELRGNRLMDKVTGGDMYYINLQKKHSYTITSVKIPLIESILEGHDDIVNLLLEMNCDINERDFSGRSALYVAALFDNVKIVKRIIEHENIDPSICDHNGRSAMHAACQEGNFTIIKLLREKIDSTLCDKDGITPLHVASEGRHTSTLKELLEKDINTYTQGETNEEMNKRDNLGRTPLFIAADKGSETGVKILIENGANIEISDKQGRTPLYTACDSNQINVVKLLIKKGANVNKCDNEGRSPILMAAAQGHNSIVLDLIRNGADVGKVDWNGRSPLYMGCKGGFDDVVKSLLEIKGTVNQCGENGKSPLHVASENGYTNIVRALLLNEAEVNSVDVYGRSAIYLCCKEGQTETAKELMKTKKLNINIRNYRNKYSPLYISCLKGYKEIVSMLLENGANVSDRNKWGRSPLHAACRDGNITIVKLLLQKNANIDETDNLGASSLYIASEDGNTEIVKLLLMYGANTSLCDDELRSPLHAACKCGHKDIIRFLLEKSPGLAHEKDNNGQTPSEIATKMGYHEISELF